MKIEEAKLKGKQAGLNSEEIDQLVDEIKKKA